MVSVQKRGIFGYILETAAANSMFARDWFIRKAMICEPRGQTELAIEYSRCTIDGMDAHPDDFEPESREPFYEDIERLRNLTNDAS